LQRQGCSAVTGQAEKLQPPSPLIAGGLHACGVDLDVEVPRKLPHDGRRDLTEDAADVPSDATVDAVIARGARPVSLYSEAFVVARAARA
jgi:hypothetical protein